MNRVTDTTAWIREHAYFKPLSFFALFLQARVTEVTADSFTMDMNKPNAGLVLDVTLKVRTYHFLDKVQA
jgi:hypothetical protein